LKPTSAQTALLHVLVPACFDATRYAALGEKCDAIHGDRSAKERAAALQVCDSSVTHFRLLADSKAIFCDILVKIADLLVKIADVQVKIADVLVIRCKFVGDLSVAHW
jgi:hypothetical protein